jgi:FKBP-type peptidyl-prolyl cis-trans isomerase FkpA
MKTNSRIIISILAVVMIFFIYSCMPKEEEYEKQEAESIKNYLDLHPDQNFELKESGLYYLETKTGSGLPVMIHDTAYVYFTLKFLNGEQIATNESTNDTLIFPALENYVLSGLDEAISYMKAGGESLLLIPSKLAYGKTGDQYSIRGYTPLLLNTRLVRVKQGSK